MSDGPQNQAQKPAQGVPLNLVKLALAKRVQSGANWFLWIAGLSLVNSFSAFAGGGFRFIVGLGLTQIIDTVAKQAGSSGSPAVMILDVIAGGIFIGFGLFARKRHEWAFLVGMILYALDGVLFVLAKDILSIAFHLLALYWIYKGLKANEALTKLEGLTPA